MKRIKEIGMILGCLFLIVSSSYAKEVVIVKKNEGADGFKYIYEWCNGSFHSLYCKDPGYSSCFIGNHGNLAHYGGYTMDQVYSIVEDAIAMGNIPGKLIQENVVITWQYLEDDELQIKIYTESDIPLQMQ